MLGCPKPQGTRFLFSANKAALWCRGDSRPHADCDWSTWANRIAVMFDEQNNPLIKAVDANDADWFKAILVKLCLALAKTPGHNAKRQSLRVLSSSEERTASLTSTSAEARLGSSAPSSESSSASQLAACCRSATERAETRSRLSDPAFDGDGS